MNSLTYPVPVEDDSNHAKLQFECVYRTSYAVTDEVYCRDDSYLEALKEAARRELIIPEGRMVVLTHEMLERDPLSFFVKFEWKVWVCTK